MSANLLWQAKEGKALEVKGPHRFISAVQELFGNLPLQLDDEDVVLLRGLSVACERTACEELIRAVAKHGVVTLWAEF